MAKTINLNVPRTAAERIARSADGWQPIETAPKDGSRIIAFAIRDGDPTIRITWWRQLKDREGYIGWGEFNTSFWPPTHWMPLPAPPHPLTPH